MTFNSEEVTSELTTILDYIRFATSQFNQAELFFGHGTQSAHDEAVALVLHTLNQPYDLSKEYLSAVLTVRERQTVVEKMQQRITTRKPLAYLTHEAIFAGLSFYVDERVLVPRSPIAELIEQQFMPWVEAEQVDRILDLCTGSGCIALACAHAFPEAQVDAVELSPDALAVATMNIERHGLQDRVVAIESDLFLAVDQRYDLIVSNPPYVNQEELRGLPQEYHAEPAMGFDGGVSGLDIVIRMLAEAENFLTSQGVLVVEVGSSAEPLQEAFPNVPFYWLEFERGGDGVFLLTAEQVSQFTDLFKTALK